MYRFCGWGDYINSSMYQILMKNVVQADANIVCSGCYYGSEARRIGQDARENFKYLIRFKMPLRHIMAGAATAIHWKLFVDISTVLSWLKVL